MKTKILFSLVILISACGPVVAQSSTEAQQVTLYNFGTPEHDESRSSINFETGKRGHLRGEQLADSDLMYGGMIIEKDGKRFPDWFRVTDSRSMIVDLGAKEWRANQRATTAPNAGIFPPAPAHADQLR